MTSIENKRITVTKDDLDLHFPEPETPLYASHLRSSVSWEHWVREMTPAWENYMKKYDKRKDRKRDPAEERFVL